MKGGLRNGRREVCWDHTAAAYCLTLAGTMFYKAFYELAVNLRVYVPFMNLQKLQAGFWIPSFYVQLTSLVHFISWYFQFIKSPLLKQKTLITSINPLYLSFPLRNFELLFQNYRAWAQAGSRAVAGQSGWGPWELSFLPALAVQGWEGGCTPSCTRRANCWDLCICSSVFVGILQLI